MTAIKWLALVPYIAILGGVFFVNRTTPFVLGMPLELAWIVLWVIASAAIMGLLNVLDPANRENRLDRELGR